jgi:putative ABC transport system substrate-binding protein
MSIRSLRASSRPTCPSSDQTKFELIVNMKTVKAIGLTLSPAFLDRVDEVIE